ncbi:MAG: hypothetical protein IKY48_07660 [Bacteroidales bacterium]|nr:hypothetical protein [Bacteroidales bacterium]
MKYLVRSVKYFFYFALLTSLILYVLVFLGMADSNIANNFEGGYSAFWKMALFYAAVAAIYPKLAFINRKLYIDPSVDISAETVRFFQDRRYVLESQSGDTMTFRLSGKGARLVKMCEDRITITRTLDGYYMEGHRKDVLRLASSLEYKFQDKED